MAFLEQHSDCAPKAKMWHIHSHLNKNLFLNWNTNESTDPFGYNGFPVLCNTIQYSIVSYNLMSGFAGSLAF